MRKISDVPEIQKHYEKCRRAGTSHRLAEMFAFQQGPSLQTDTRFNIGNVNHNQFAHDPEYGAMALAKAKAAGVSVEGAVYHEQLAQEPGDPNAWVRDRSDVKRICQERGRTVEGAVNYKPAMEDGPSPDELWSEPYQAAEDLVDEAVEAVIAENPTALQDDPNLRETVAKRISGHEEK